MPRHLHLNTSENGVRGGTWEADRFGQREYSVALGYWLATAVIVGMQKRDKHDMPVWDDDGNPVMIYFVQSVRVEDTRWRETHQEPTGDTWEIPGMIYSLGLDKTGIVPVVATVRTKKPWKFQCNRMGRPNMTGGHPEVAPQRSDSQSDRAIPLECHRIGDILRVCGRMALQSYEDWREAQRAA